MHITRAQQGSKASVIPRLLRNRYRFQFVLFSMVSALILNQHNYLWHGIWQY